MISLRGVSVHNLKGVDLDLPTGKLIVFCGRSGSGKSSLALDTLYAEGQRRYIETFSPAIRHFLEKIEKPKAELLDGIPPAIAVTGSTGKSTAETLGDLTELTDYLALLFASTGHVFCPKCSRLITADTPQSIWSALQPRLNTKIQIAFTPPLEESAAEFAAVWKEQGFVHAQFNETPLRLDEPIPPHCYRTGLWLIADRLTLDAENEDRFIESAETALDFGDGRCGILTESGTLLFSRFLSCDYCGIHVPELTAKVLESQWKNYVHLTADIESPTLADMLTWKVSALIDFFEKTFP